MTVRLGILALLEAKDGAGDKLAAFLEAGREIAVAMTAPATRATTSIAIASNSAAATKPVKVESQKSSRNVESTMNRK